MKQIISLLLLISWTFSSLAAKTEAMFIFDHSSHIQTIIKQNSESETPDHYQSFFEIDLKDEKSRLLFIFISILPELNDPSWYSNIAYYSATCYAFHAPVVISLHSPTYIKVRQILI